jgi:hypothetical protein
MMNVFNAGDPGAVDLLALARLDDVLPAVTPPPASDGSHAISLAGAGQVTASRAEMIAAAPGRARQQLTPALMGVG